MKKDGLNGKIFKIGDLIVLAVFIIAAALAIYFMTKPTGSEVYIYKDGKLFEAVSLSTEKTVKVDEHITVKISGGAAYVLKSDCKGQDCVKAGKISKVGEMIVCLPNKVVMKIVGDGEVDYITG
ncbi:putative uncharacterized protein [Acidaminococcus sp. CAG:917]|nr:putative uncharacterized protein [Acidaminococcus sp. CAG:917]